MNHPPIVRPPLKEAIIVAPSAATVNSGTTEFFQSAEKRSMGRVRYDRSRALVAYAFWDPYKNNPGPAAVSSLVDSAGVPFAVLGKILIGNQEAMEEFSFDIPWGQMISAPVSSEQCEISARLVRLPDATAPIIDIQTWNDPPLIDLTGVDLPNVSVQFPRGFVAVVGGIGEGASHGQIIPLTRCRQLAPLPAGTTRTTPLAYGARRVKVTGDPILTMAISTTIDSGATPNLAINQWYVLPNITTAVNVFNATLAPSVGFANVIYELGL